MGISHPFPAQVEIVASGREAVVFLNALVNQRHAYPTRQGGEALHVLAHPDVVVLATLAEAARADLRVLVGDLRGFQSFNPTSMCAYLNGLDLAL